MQLTVPYVTTAEFIEYPTFLDLLNLRSGDTQLRDQTATLQKVLLMASRKCDNYCEMGADGTLSAHNRVESKRLRADRGGRLHWHPDHIPFVSLTSVAYGQRIGALTTATGPSTFVEDNRLVVVDLQSGGSAWSGRLQFGAASTGTELFTTWNYVAGYPNTLLTAPANTGAVALQVLDAVGIQPGQGLRLYDPGADENVTVGPAWVPAAGAATVPLATPLLNPHPLTAPVRLTAFGEDVMEACVNHAIALLMRPDTQAEDSFPDMRGGISTRLADSRKDGSGLVFEAQHLLEPYRRTV